MEHGHSHEISSENEKKIFIIIIFTVITMVAEIVYGYVTHSMALLADGFHMGTHAFALSLAYVAYILIRKLKDSPKFPRGTEKIGILAGYTSSIVLMLTGFWIIFEAIERFIRPIEIHFNEALIVALIGLLVNAVCIFVMEGSHEHKHEEENKKDYNYKSAYYHILADIMTSFLAIGALLAGKYFSLMSLDSVVGILGGILILKWAAGMIGDTAKILVDME